MNIVTDNSKTIELMQARIDELETLLVEAATLVSELVEKLKDKE